MFADSHPAPSGHSLRWYLGIAVMLVGLIGMHALATAALPCRQVGTMGVSTSMAADAFGPAMLTSPASTADDPGSTTGGYTSESMLARASSDLAVMAGDHTDAGTHGWLLDLCACIAILTGLLALVLARFRGKQPQRSSGLIPVFPAIVTRNLGLPQLSIFRLSVLRL